MTTSAQLPEYDDGYGLGDAVSANTSRKLALVEEETRIKFVIDSVVNIGNVEFKQPDGTVKVSYQLGIGLTSNRAQRFEDNGEETGRFVSFMIPFTLSFHPKGNLAKSGLLDAVSYDITKVTREQVIEGLIGKQVSAMITHRKYKTNDGVEAMAMDLEKFKAVADQDDFSQALAVWKPHAFAAKKFADKKVITLANVKEKQAGNTPNVKTVGAYSVGPDKPVISTTIKLT